MKLVLLGSTGYHPNNLRHTACVMLPSSGAILDAGTGFFRAAERLETDQLDIFLSHTHLDHCVGLTFLFDVLRDRPMRRTTVHGEADKLAAFQEHILSPLIFPVALPCDYRPLTAPVRLIDGGLLSYFPLEHPGGSLGFRIDWPGHSMAYITDTTARLDAPYVRLIEGVDLLIHECYFPDEQHLWAKQTGHSHTTPVAEVARAAQVGELVLVHLWPAIEQLDPINLAVAQAIFPRTRLGTDLLEIEF